MAISYRTPRHLPDVEISYILSYTSYMSTDNHPPIIIISGAIGSGKGTILHALVRELPLTWAPTHTTRPVRRDDTALSHRIFDTDTNFVRSMSRGEFIESVEIAGHRYGVLRSDLEKELRLNHPVVLEVSVDGGLEIKRHYPNTLLLFLLSPQKERSSRIVDRKQDSQEIAKRMKDATQEEKIAKAHYDYLIENIEGHPEEAIEAIKDIINDTFHLL
jgi:guanylate kinase